MDCHSEYEKATVSYVYQGATLVCAEIETLDYR